MSDGGTTLLINADTFIAEDTPSRVMGGSALIALDNGTGFHRYALLHVAVPNLVGSTVTLANLGVTMRTSNWTAGDQIKVDLLVNPFTEQSTWNNYHTLLPSLPTAHQVVHTVTGTAAGHRETINITQLLVDAAQTANFYGLLLSTQRTTTGRQLFSSEGTTGFDRPYLHIVYSQAPPPPTDLLPSIAASAAKPRFSWSSINQAAYNVQISSTQNGVSPDVDTGWVSSTDTGYDSTAAVSWSPPLSGSSTSWRVRTQNAAGAITDWSPWATYTRRAYSSLTITFPANNGDAVDATTPTIAWSFGATQTAYEVLVDEFDSLRTPAADAELELPAGVVTEFGVSYQAEVRTWDTYTRDAPGELGYVVAQRTFVYDNSGSATAPVATLTATTDGPAIVLTWTRSSAPDSFLVVANGIVQSTLDPVDVFVSGTTYRSRWLQAQPNEPTTWEIRAHDDLTGDSTGNPTADATLQPQGIWLTYEPDGLEVQLLGQDEIDMKITEDGATFLPLGRRAPIRIVDQIRGYEGSFSGLIVSEEDLDTFNLIKAVDPDSTDVRLIFGTYSFPIEMGEVTVSELPVAGGDVAVAYQVSSEFWQNGPPWPDGSTT